MSKQLLLAPLVIGLGACSTIPTAELRYYPAASSTTVTVTRTLSCNKPATGQPSLMRSETATVVTTYAADREGDPQILSASSLNGSFSDADIKLDWYDDGRLKAVNQSSTGQGESIVKAALSLAPLVGGGGVGGVQAFAAPSLGAADCDALIRLGDGKPVTLTYEATIKSPSTTAVPPVLQPVANDRAMAAAVGALAGVGAAPPVVTFTVATKSGALVEDSTPAGGSSDAVALPLFKTAVATVKVVGANGQISEGQVIVPTRTPFVVPIPRPKAFGKQVFALALNEAGGITSVGYTKESGAASALNAVNAVATTVSPGDAAKAAAANSEADLIVARQRLAACQAKPADCK